MTPWNFLQAPVGSQPERSVPRRRYSARFENIDVVNQFGESFRFRDDLVADRMVVINTMYTTCRGSCPTTGTVLMKLRRDLTDLFGSRIALVSMTLEPEVDSIAVMRRYSQDFGAGQRRDDLCPWHFVTGQPHAMDRLRRSLDFFDLDPRVDQDLSQHDATLLFGNDQSDRWANLPAAVRYGQLLATIRRIVGESFEVRFGIAG
ncbi:MAG: SCO family protein [Pirellulaceae bacterium]